MRTSLEAFKMMKKHFIVFALLFFSIVFTSFNAPLAQETQSQTPTGVMAPAPTASDPAQQQVVPQEKSPAALELEQKEVPSEEGDKATKQAGAPPPEKRLSRIESILLGKYPPGRPDELKQFGYGFFNKETSSFAPIKSVPVGQDYIVGPGDSFIIHLWGRTEVSHPVTVSREGHIMIPRIGILPVTGLSFGELKASLNRKFKEFYPDFKMIITMGELRTIQVFVVGEAKTPGTFSVSSLSTVITALYEAGGPTKNGSLRDIQLLRNGNAIQKLDLYAFFIKGVKAGDIRLQPGDTIFIPVIGPVVGIAGNVKRPAIYEMKGTQTVGEVLEYAGGILPTGELQSVMVERIEGHRRRIIKSFSLDPAAQTIAKENMNLPLSDGDLIKIYPIHSGIGQIVYLEGHVKYPREYELKQGMRLRDLIPSYGALLPEPYMPQAEIIRLTPPDLHTEIIEFDLGALLAGNDEQNLLLQDQDRVRIYSQWEKEDIPQVRIEGAIRKQGNYRLYKEMTIKDLIFQAGNLEEKAYMERADLTRLVNLGDKVETLKLSFSPKKAIKGIPEDNLELKADDTIHIREIPQYRMALQRKIYLQGEFQFPGEYSYSEGESLNSVITRAGGLTEEAYPFGARFFRESVKEVQRVRLNQYITKLEEDILTIGTVTAETVMDEDQAKIVEETLEAKKKLLEKLKKADVTGRMVLNLEETILIPNSVYDIQLEPEDRLIVAKKPSSVNVLGEVYNPTALLFEESKTVAFYLNRVGGTTKEADRKQMYLVKADGTVMSKTQEGFFGLAAWDTKKQRWTVGGGFDSQKMDPGDTIIVPIKIQTYPWLKVAKDITQILANVALTAGVIIAAMD